jgi:RNA polymerase sigma factor (sigma-70 family)
MPTQLNEIVQFLRRTVSQQDEPELTDGQLLGRFIEHRDEAAVAALVRRHGPMVWGVCRRLLHNHHDAEDAFQASFLVLIRKPASVKPREMVGNWLYGVAHQTALKARATTTRRRAKERQVTAVPDAQAAEPDTGRELQAVLDQELSWLPDKYRVAIVVCDLEGKTRKEAARQLGLPEGTLAGRLRRGRAILAKRLVRHGLAVSAATLAGILTQEAASASLPSALMTSTIKVVTMAAAGKAASAGAMSATVAALTERVIKAMLVNKLVKMTAVVLVLTGLGLGVAGTAPGLLADQSRSDEAPALVHAIRLPLKMATRLHLQTAEVKARAAAKPLVLHFSGSLALDPEKISRIRARYGGEVIEIGTKGDRPLRPGDPVSQGDSLAVVSNPGVAQKKKDLFDAVVQLKMDERALEGAEKAPRAGPEVLLLNARRKVQADMSAVAHAENVLKTWGTPENEIEGVRQEAREAAEKNKPDSEEARQARLKRWAEVVLWASFDGTLIERNCSPHEIIVDSTVTLFTIANLDRLLVVANVPEQDLPGLQELEATDRRWTVTAAGSAPCEGVIDGIDYIAEPDGLSAVVKGHVDNKEHRLRAGQLITASITVLPATGEVWLPAAAVVEQGEQTFVFVQPDVNKSIYEQRRVLIARRSQEAVHIRAGLTPEQKRRGFQTLRPGERVITAGALELKAIFDDLKANDRP